MKNLTIHGSPLDPPDAEPEMASLVAVRVGVPRKTDHVHQAAQVLAWLDGNLPPLTMAAMIRQVVIANVTAGDGRKEAS